MVGTGILSNNMRGFHRIFATGAACQQSTLTPPDTWSCPNFGLAIVLMLGSISPELVLFPDFEFRTSLGTSVLRRTLLDITMTNYSVASLWYPKDINLKAESSYSGFQNVEKCKKKLRKGRRRTIHNYRLEY